MKKLTGFIAIAIILMISSCSLGDSSEQRETARPEEHAEFEEASVRQAAFIYEDMINSFKDATTRGSEEISYPDYYGGAYIDDNGDLIVYIKGTPSDMERSKAAISAFAKNDKISFKEADFSYTYLNEIMEILNDYKRNNDNEYANNFNVYYLSETDNRIVVELDDYTENSIEEFKENILDSPALIFKNSDGHLVVAVDVKCGTQITDGTYGVSFGYRVKRGSDKGFITAGHLPK